MEIQSHPGIPIVFRHARVVLEDSIIEDGAVAVAGGIIADIGETSQVSTQGAVVINANGALLIPGLVDTHNDGVEREVNPRPRVGFSRPFAIANYARRAVAAGVTTSFHAVTFGNMVRNTRSVDEAVAITDAIREASTTGGIDHQVLHRCDVWSPDGIDNLFASMRRFQYQAMSLNDHTPGQGQYRNLDGLKGLWGEYRQAGYNMGNDDDRLAQLMHERAADTTTLPRVWGRAAEELSRETYVLSSHDDDTPEKVDQMASIGCTISEFPVTTEAAARAREHGMKIIVGAPNIVRGGSTTGNASALDLIKAGLADIICADYHSPSMLEAPFRVFDLGLRSLPESIAMVTRDAAHTFGMVDRGVIRTGMRADLALVVRTDGVAEATLVMRGGEIVHATRAGLMGVLPATALASRNGNATSFAERAVH
ncbi:MAG: alpha-D-ribose 1-methylphosphonate 5-triphosphate diphosphatase [Proteobacteria bacterium]|nr:alpha-D-ribose 1-methylphosphonate 5-triphosphate diphosphatase [Pseudomonadota bacterium]